MDLYGSNFSLLKGWVVFKAMSQSKRQFSKAQKDNSLPLPPTPPRKKKPQTNQGSNNWVSSSCKPPTVLSAQVPQHWPAWQKAKPKPCSKFFFPLPSLPMRCKWMCTNYLCGSDLMEDFIHSCPVFLNWNSSWYDPTPQWKRMKYLLQ